MATPLLQTKLYIPPLRPGVVSRPRLVERLEEGLRPGCKLTLVSAPAGFGKTTLLSEWIAGCLGPVAWLSLDEGDNDVSRFWSYVVTALQKVEPTIGQAALGALQAAQAALPPLEPLLASLMNDVSALELGDRPCILVLDDYHVLETQAVHESVDDLIEHLPPGLRLVIASRQDPPLALSLLRGRGQLNEIRAADLRFTSTETTEFLSAGMGLNLSTGDIAALENRTEGWVVGLQMAALSLRGQTDPEAHDFVSTFAGDDRYVADYLLDQVLRRQPPHIQRFLIQTSILGRLCGPLCDAVTGQGSSPGASSAGSQQVLEYLERAGLLIVPLDNRRHWYRYHRLFADLLRSHLQAVSTLSADSGGSVEIAELHRRTSAWYEGEGWITEAVDHALAAADHERAADLIQRHYKETIWTGEWTTVRRWLEALPEALIRSQPFLCLIYGCLSLLDAPEQVEGWLQAAEEAWETWAAQSQPLYESMIPLGLSDRELFDANMLDVRATIAGLQGASSEEIIALTQQALQVTPESVPALRAAMFQRLGWCYLNLDQEDAASRAFLQAIQLAEIEGHHGNIIGATCGQAILAWRHGRLRDAAAICGETLRSVVEPLERSGRRLPAAGNLYIILGRLLLQLYELESAESALVKGVELAELTLGSGALPDGYHALASLRCIERDFEGALAWMEVAERTCTWDRERVCGLLARIWLWRAQVELGPQYLDLALEWARGRDLECAADSDWELPSLALAYIAGHLTYGKPDLAPLLSILDKRLRLAEAASKTDGTIKTLILQVLVLQAMGQIEQAMVLLERALALAAPHRYALAFVRHGAPMQALLWQAAARGISTDYVNQLLSLLAKETGEQQPRTTLPQRFLLEPLSKRELEVLRLLTTSLTGPEIADQLSISVGTFRTHTKSIYGKLGVHSRIEAIECAQALELV